jgi:hypothetical protein
MHERRQSAGYLLSCYQGQHIMQAFLIFSGEIISLHYLQAFSAADLLPSPHDTTK